MYIKIDLNPIACPRPRVTRWGTYYPPKYTEFKKKAQFMLSILPKFEGELLEVNLMFIIKRPKNLYRKKDPDSRIPHAKKPDIDNLIKSALDLLQSSGLIRDDCIIYKLIAEKYYASKEEKPSIIIQIKRGYCSEYPLQQNKTSIDGVTHDR